MDGSHRQRRWKALYVVTERSKDQFEFKVVEPESDEDLADAVEEGLKQIIDGRYLDGSEMEGAIALSVAFRRKTCEVAFIDPV